MRKGLKIAFSSALIGAVAACAIPADVLAMGAAPPSAVGLSSQVDKAAYRRWGGGYRPYYSRYRWAGYRGYRPYYGGYYRRYYPGAAVAAGLLGAGLAASGSGYYGGYYPYYNYNNYYYPGYGYGYYNAPSYDYWGW